MKKLESYGFRGVANVWFSTYLSKRKQYVHNAGEHSAIEKSSMGKIKKSKRSSLLSQTSCHIPYSKTHLLRSLLTTHQICLTDLGENISRNSRVATLQRIAIHVIVFSDCDSSSKPMFLRTSILSIHQFSNFQTECNTNLRCY